MPIYEYECRACKRGPFDVFRPVSDTSPELCTKCGEAMNKLMSSFAYDNPMIETSDMHPDEVALHRHHKKDVENAAKNGTLKSFKPSKKKPSELQPKFEKTLH